MGAAAARSPFDLIYLPVLSVAQSSFRSPPSTYSIDCAEQFGSKAKRMWELQPQVCLSEFISPPILSISQSIWFGGKGN